MIDCVTYAKMLQTHTSDHLPRKMQRCRDDICFICGDDLGETEHGICYGCQKEFPVKQYDCKEQTNYKAMEEG